MQVCIAYLHESITKCATKTNTMVSPSFSSTVTRNTSFPTSSNESAHKVHTQPSWAQNILAASDNDDRARPWQNDFGVPITNDLNAEDWIEYPTAFNVSKKGIAG